MGIPARPSPDRQSTILSAHTKAARMGKLTYKSLGAPNPCPQRLVEGHETQRLAHQPKLLVDVAECWRHSLQFGDVDLGIRQTGGRQNAVEHAGMPRSPVGRGQEDDAKDLRDHIGIGIIKSPEDVSLLFGQFMLP